MPQFDPPIDIEDPAQLRAYLAARRVTRQSESIEITLLHGGVSNRTVHIQHGQSEMVLKQALPKLRVAVDWFSDPRRIHIEAQGLRALNALLPGSTPELIFEDPAQDLLAMRAVPKPHDNFKTLLLRGPPQPDRVRQFADLLADMHRRAFGSRDQLRSTFADRSFFESLRIEPYYQYTAEQVPQAASFLQSLIRTTRATSLTLVHGDYSPKNILIHSGRLVLLDHEVIHWGDPAFDVGFSITHLLSKAHHCIAHRDGLLHAAHAYWTRYDGQLGDVPWRKQLDRAGARHTMACLLARCRGRSPLEYLDEQKRAHQARIVLALLEHPPASLHTLIDAFAERL
jgi:aminoglycoside phosphotransferase (APT) family kinase protein